MKFGILFIIFLNLEASNLELLLFNGNCTTCHFINENKSAPSMKKIQAKYKKAFPKKVDFVNYMSNWVEHPNKDTSLMLNAISKYGLMPELGFEKEVLKGITSYIYNLK